jgi:hypothetical protein
MVLPSLVIAFITHEWFVLPGFLLTALLSIGFGQWLYRRFDSSGSPHSPSTRRFMRYLKLYLDLPAQVSR